MPSLTQPLILPNLINLAQHSNALDWEPFRPGVMIHWLYQCEQTEAAAALLRYQPGATIPHHDHTGFEHIFVLSGSQRDRNGAHQAGTLVINPPQTDHDVTSDEGCIVLIIWQKPVAMRQSVPSLESHQS
jgi:anti-sigma factor ChrR (cupin superfamily)